MKPLHLQTAGEVSIALENPNFYRDLPFLLIACLLHGFILSKNIGFQWTMPAPKPETAIAIEIVEKAPNPALLAPMAPGTGKKDSAFHHGPGPIRMEKVKRGLPAVRKAKRKKAIDPTVLAAMKAKRLERQRLMLEQLKQEQEKQRQLTLQRAEERRIRMERLAEQRRIEAERLAEQHRIQAERLAEQRKLEAERQTAIAKAKEEERQRILAERRAALERQRQIEAERRRIQAEKLAALREMQVTQKAEVERQLAALPNPDEVIADASGMPDAGPSTGPKVGKATGAGGGVLLASAAIGRAAAGGADLQADEGDTDGRDGKDALNMTPSGGGPGVGDGGPVSWSLEGPIGSRRLLRRIVPPLPDIVTKRSLDLVVTLRFRVMENGEIRDAIIIKKTSGWVEVDRLAIEALRRWKFDAYHPQHGAKSPTVWGVVSFRFVAA